MLRNSGLKCHKNVNIADTAKINLRHKMQIIYNQPNDFRFSWRISIRNLAEEFCHFQILSLKTVFAFFVESTFFFRLTTKWRKSFAYSQSRSGKFRGGWIFFSLPQILICWPQGSWYKRGSFCTLQKFPSHFEEKVPIM